MKKKHIADFFLIIGLLLITVISAIFIYKDSDSDDLYVEISIDGEIVDRIQLDKDFTTVLSTGNKLVIKDATVTIDDADCPDKLCVKQGSIHKSNESIICLPNKLVVRIVNNNSSNKQDDKDLDVIQ